MIKERKNNDSFYFKLVSFNFILGVKFKNTNFIVHGSSIVKIFCKRTFIHFNAKFELNNFQTYRPLKSRAIQIISGCTKKYQVYGNYENRSSENSIVSGTPGL